MKKRGFTLLEVVFAITGFLLLLVVIINTYVGISKLRYNIQAKQSLIETNQNFFERINRLIHDGYTIDYEEYFNRLRVGCSDERDPGLSFWYPGESGHCSNFTAYGNRNKFTSIEEKQNHQLYLCSSVTGDPTYPGGYPFVVNNTTLGNGCWQYAPNAPGDKHSYQSYGEYGWQFWDFADDADSNGSVVNDDDDIFLGQGPIAIEDNRDVIELYLISHDKTQRVYFRKAFIEETDLNGDGATTGAGEKLYTLQMLRLRGFDAGEEHDFDTAKRGVYDGRIDTWACDAAEGFTCQGSGVGTGEYSGFQLPIDLDDGWVTVSPPNVTITDWNIIVSPTKDPDQISGTAKIVPFTSIRMNPSLYGTRWYNKLGEGIEGVNMPGQMAFGIKSVYYDRDESMLGYSEPSEGMWIMDCPLPEQYGWEYVGDRGFGNANADYQSLGVGDNRIFKVGYRDGGISDEASAMQYDGTSWQKLGDAGFSKGAVGKVALAVSPIEYQTFMAFSDAGFANRTSVMRFNGTSWVDVGSPGFGGTAANHDIAIDENGTPYVAYRDSDAGGKITVMVYTGPAGSRTWVEIGDPLIIPLGNEPSIVINAITHTVYVAYIDANNGNNISVIALTDTTTTQVGSAGFADGGRDGPSLGIMNNMLAVAFVNDANAGRIGIMTYDLGGAGAWTTVGGTTCTEADTSYPSLQIDVNYTIYVAYADTADIIGGKESIGKTSVVKIDYPYTSCEYIGIRKFSDYAKYQSLVLGPSNMPYVAFSDYGEGYRTSAMRYASINTSPDKYTVNGTCGVLTATLIESLPVQIFGPDVATPIEVYNAEYRIWSGDWSGGWLGWTSAPDTFEEWHNGIQMRVMSPSQEDEIATGYINIGCQEATFVVTTSMCPPPPMCEEIVAFCPTCKTPPCDIDGICKCLTGDIMCMDDFDCQ